MTLQNLLKRIEMANFVTTDYIIGIVYGLLSSINVKKYRITKPPLKVGQIPESEYIVINSLPIPADVMQKVFVNVNYHVLDLASGVPDSEKLLTGSNRILAVLKKVTGANYMIDFEQQETHREESLGESFSNLRFSFKYINN